MREATVNKLGHRICSHIMPLVRRSKTCHPRTARRRQPLHDVTRGLSSSSLAAVLVTLAHDKEQDAVRSPSAARRDHE